MDKTLLEVKNLCSGYSPGNYVLNDISVKVNEGEILAVIGPNGCGKTTLLKTLARLLPYRGTITLESGEISSLKRNKLAKKIALLSQNAGVYFPYSVYETAALGRFPHSENFFKTLTPEDEKIINDVLIKLELLEEKDRLINELSGGQLQRVFLARTLIQNPDIILLDEPTNHLDLKHQLELLDYLSLWVTAEPKRAVIAVLHDLNLARRFAHNTALLCRGLLVSIGETGQVLSGDTLKEVYGIDIKSFMRESLENWK